MTKELAGRTAVITGASQGLGLAIAQAYSQAGARVAIASRRQAAIEAAAQSIRDAGGEAVGLQCDVGQWDQIKGLAQAVIERWGHFDIWVNNAGLSPAYGPTWQIPIDRIQQALQTNIHGVAYGSWLAMHHFQERGQGVLINLMGRGSRRPAPFQNAYGSSKAWVRSFSQGLAEEVDSDNIRVIAFNPGLVYTALVEEVASVPSAQDRLQVFSTVLAFLGNPPDVPAQRAVWLASEAGSRAGSEYSLTNLPRTIMQGLARGLAMLLGNAPSKHPIEISAIEPARNPFDQSSTAEGRGK